MLESLTELGKKNDTDKVCHRYLPHYERRFADRRDEEITLLEIGVWKGQSLRTWRDYFPAGQIYGIDVVEESIFEEERIRCFLGDQRNAEFLAGVVADTGPLDIVVDDGSHRGVDHVASFAALWPHLKEGGWYCIEDCFSIFNECWTKPGDRTILELIGNQWDVILLGQSEIAEVTVISDGINDGLIFIRKRAPLEEP